MKMTNYSYADNGYPDLAVVIQQYRARSVVLIGGQRALAAAANSIREALQGSKVTITGEFVYGKDSTRSNIRHLRERPEVQAADLLFAIGGGKAIDTVKSLSLELGKEVFTFPTITSNCSATTAISVIYNDDGSLEGYDLPQAPAHSFINGRIVAEAPEIYLWSGIGDALSKQPEVHFASQGKVLDHTARMGVTLAKACDAPLMQFGEAALEACRNNTVYEAIREVSLTILITTGYVSNLTNQADYYYNSSLAHAFYNGATVLPALHEHLHGEVVSFGVLVLHAYTGNEEALRSSLEFHQRLGLPLTLADMGLNVADLPAIADAATFTNEWRHAPYPFTKDAFMDAITKADRLGQELKQAAA